MCLHSNVMTEQTCAICAGVVRCEVQTFRQARRDEARKKEPMGRRFRVPGVDLRTAFEPRPTREFKGETIPDPEMLECSFCGAWTHQDQITLGRGPIQSAQKDRVVDTADGPVLDSTVNYFSTKLRACPRCVLNIKPVVNKDGSITNTIILQSNQ